MSCILESELTHLALLLWTWHGGRTVLLELRGTAPLNLIPTLVCVYLDAAKFTPSPQPSPQELVSTKPYWGFAEMLPP